jgi:hypothetical protein
MAMTPKLRNSVIAAVGGGAIAIASALITGPPVTMVLKVCDTTPIRMW